MSFMDTKYAVQTCVLSKTWIDIWKSLPFLDFNRSSFSQDKKDSFVKFVDMVFNFHKDFDIQELRVHWIKNSAYDNTLTENVNRWIIEAVKYNVQVVDILITQCHDSLTYEIPHHLLNCKSLKKLKMVVGARAKYADIILPRLMNLPQLKALWLTGISISDVESSKRLFSSCPVLETLHIRDCNIQTDNQRNLTINSLSLDRFEYTHRRRTFLEQNDTMANTIKLCAPNLANFTCTSFFTQDYSLENLSPLSKVKLYMKLETKEEHENAERYLKLPSMVKDVYAIRMMKFLGALSMVKYMELSSSFLEVLSQAPDLLKRKQPCFPNLKRLKLDMWFTRSCLRAIAYLLKNSPQISQLSLFSNESNLADVGDGWGAGLSLRGKLSRLTSVHIKEVEGCDNELKFLSFLLKNAKVLKILVLCPRTTIDSPDTVRNLYVDKLSTLRKASSHIKMIWRTTNTADIVVPFRKRKKRE